MIKIGILTIVFIISGCASIAIPKSNPKYKVGTWCESDDGGISCFGFTTYHKNGHLVSFGHDTQYNMGGYSEGKWWHEGDKSCISSTYNYQYSLRPRARIETPLISRACNKIIHHDEIRFVYMDRDGETHTMYRVTPFEK